MPGLLDPQVREKEDGWVPKNLKGQVELNMLQREHMKIKLKEMSKYIYTNVNPIRKKASQRFNLSNLSRMVIKGKPPKEHQNFSN